MMCISLWQPWASLMAMGEKRIETRSWKPPLRRGEVVTLAIHAAKKWDNELRAMCGTQPFRSLLGINWSGASFHKDGRTHVLPLGCIVAVVDLVGWLTTEECVKGVPKVISPISDAERALGDYSPGRYGWITTNLRRLPEPVPFKGAQGLFDVPDNLVADGGGR